jgi:hypothetical protein
MSSIRSLNSIYSSSSEDEDSCFSQTSDKPDNDSLSVSHPLFFTLTMGSGSSGANTTVSSMSGSEPFSSTGTPIDTPPDTPGAESCTNETVTGNRVGVGVGKEGLSARRDTALRIPLDALDTFKSQLSRSPHVLLQSMDQHTNYDSCDEEEEGEHAGEEWPERKKALGKVHLKGRGLPRRVASGFQSKDLHTKDYREETLATLSAMGTSLRRARRPPPLNLSLVSYPSPNRRSPEVVAKGTETCTEESFSDTQLVVERPLSLPQTAPLPPVLKSPMDLAPIPHTAPLSRIPRAPLIQPSNVHSARSPSPLALPSPGLPWSLNNASLTPATPWTVDSMVTPLLSTPLRMTDAGARARKVSLSKQMANLFTSSAISPVPPSLKDSPFLISPASPFGLRDPERTSSRWPGSNSKLHSPRVSHVGTPLKRHMNPYFSQAVVTHESNGQVGSP